MIVYLAMEERTGKTLISLLLCERLKINSVLVLTKKKALGGWQETLAAFPHSKTYQVANYHQAKKLKPVFDLVILDEAHNYISGFPKRSAMWSAVRALTKKKPLIYMTATPYAQGPQGLFNQLALSDWSPWRSYTSPYNWFRHYGIPDPVYLPGRTFESYKKCKTDEVLACVQHLFITKTRKELGFEHEPEDKLHYIELDTKTKQVYNHLLKRKVLNLNGHDLVCDTSSKLRFALHMIEGGSLKIKKLYMTLGNTEKVDYIMETWGDTDTLVIMYNYIAEKAKLETKFKKAMILQATSFAEGIDLSHMQDLVIYSQDFSTARHVQRRARQANKNREHPIVVHYLLVKKAISEQVYQTVSINKTNFVDRVFQRSEL